MPPWPPVLEDERAAETIVWLKNLGRQRFPRVIALGTDVPGASSKIPEMYGTRRVGVRHYFVPSGNLADNSRKFSCSTCSRFTDVF